LPKGPQGPGVYIYVPDATALTGALLVDGGLRRQFVHQWQAVLTA
jgi:hypothetical protein